MLYRSSLPARLLLLHSHLCRHRQATSWEWPPTRMGRTQAHPARERQSQSLNLHEIPGPKEKGGHQKPSTEACVSPQLVEGQLYRPALWLGSEASYF